jgi:pinin/SDK/memA/ protein conserved region
VIVPDAEESTPTEPVSAKRRRSSVSNEENKRARISPPQDQAIRPSVTDSYPRSTTQGPRGQDSEERKRGKRLFGALLGALNQSSSSVAERRRGDIERKQQEKLKLQTQEHNEQQKKQREDLFRARRQEQEVYLKQAVRVISPHFKHPF